MVQTRTLAPKAKSLTHAPLLLTNLTEAQTICFVFFIATLEKQRENENTLWVYLGYAAPVRNFYVANRHLFANDVSIEQRTIHVFCHVGPYFATFFQF